MFLMPQSEKRGFWKAVCPFDFVYSVWMVSMKPQAIVIWLERNITLTVDLLKIMEHSKSESDRSAKLFSPSRTEGQGTELHSPYLIRKTEFNNNKIRKAMFSSKLPLTFNRLDGATFQKTKLFVTAAVRTSNPRNRIRGFGPHCDEHSDYGLLAVTPCSLLHRYQLLGV
jgi:hypothetical protein